MSKNNRDFAEELIYERAALVKTFKSWRARYLSKKGGYFLAAARNYVLCHVPQGDNVTWASDDKVKITMRQLEELASEVAAAAIEDFISKHLANLSYNDILKVVTLKNNHEVPTLGDMLEAHQEYLNKKARAFNKSYEVPTLEEMVKNY